jgi:hypothetical protein
LAISEITELPNRRIDGSGIRKKEMDEMTNTHDEPTAAHMDAGAVRRPAQ